MLELCRVTGLSLMIFVIFPKLDVGRCILVTCAALFMPLFVNVITKFSEVYLSSQNSLRKIFLLVKTIPKSFFALLLFSGTYLWLVLRADFPHTYALSAGIFLYAIGNWEFWIDERHSGGRFHNLFQVGNKVLPFLTFQFPAQIWP